MKFPTVDLYTLLASTRKPGQPKQPLIEEQKAFAERLLAVLQDEVRLAQALTLIEFGIGPYYQWVIEMPAEPSHLAAKRVLRNLPCTAVVMDDEQDVDGLKFKLWQKVPAGELDAAYLLPFTPSQDGQLPRRNTPPQQLSL